MARDQNTNSPANVNSDLRITNEAGNTSNVTVSGNYLLGGAYTVEAGSTNTTYTVSNVSIANNYIGYSVFGAYYPPTAGITETGNTTIDFTNPAPWTQAQAAYQAAGLPTANVVSATTSNVWAIASGSTPTTVLGNSIVGEDLQGGAGETNFVGGAGAQHLYAGKGANILTYLAVSDGGDTVAGFDPAKDVIDLSHIDADLTAAGVQNFISSAPARSTAPPQCAIN